MPHNEQPTHPNEQAHRHRRDSVHTPRISKHAASLFGKLNVWTCWPRARDFRPTGIPNLASIKGRKPNQAEVRAASFEPFPDQQCCVCSTFRYKSERFVILFALCSQLESSYIHPRGGADTEFFKPSLKSLHRKCLWVGTCHFSPNRTNTHSNTTLRYRENVRIEDS